jgi:excisionase family DNA binding protein
MTAQSNLLTINEAAALLRLKPSTLRMWVHKRRIPFVRLGSRIFFRRADIDAEIERGLVPAAAPQENSRNVTANRREPVVATQPISAEVLQ